MHHSSKPTKLYCCIIPIKCESIDYGNIIKVSLLYYFVELKSVLLCGIESQVCVQNTVLDLVESGLDVHVIADAVSSRSMVDR